MKWKLTTESPQESNYYLTVMRFADGEYILPPSPMLYSRKNDAWNSSDNDNCEKRIEDMRDYFAARREDVKSYDSFVYAWCEVTVSEEELNALLEAK